MRFSPRSLFGRTALLIAALAVLSQLLSATLLYFYYAGPRVERAARGAATYVETLTLALERMPASHRQSFVNNLAQNHNVHIVFAGEAPGAEVSNNVFTKMFEDQVNAQTKRPVQVRWQTQWLWIRPANSALDAWIGLPRPPAERELYWPVLGWLLLGGLLGLLGALWIARRLNRPLRALTQAAALLGRGETPHDLPESGTTEIATLSRSFNQMARDVQRLTADRTLLLAGVSHDLRTPLSRLRLALEMLGDKTDATLKPGMIQDVDDMDRIVEQFLAYVRDGEVEVVRQGDLNELVQATAARYLRQGQEINLDLTPLPMLALRAVAMQRLLSNLIDNALRHGGGEVEVRTRTLGDRVSLGVLDRGPGLPATQPNDRAQPYRPRLGLVVVERIAQLHKGRLQLNARDGGGLEARVEIPLPAVRA